MTIVVPRAAKPAAKAAITAAMVVGYLSYVGEAANGDTHYRFTRDGVDAAKNWGEDVRSQAGAPPLPDE